MNKDRLLEEIKGIARSMITASHYDNLPETEFENYLKEMIAKTASIKDAEIAQLKEESEARNEIIKRLVDRFHKKEAEHQQKIAEIKAIQNPYAENIFPRDHRWAGQILREKGLTDDEIGGVSGALGRIAFEYIMAEIDRLLEP